MNGTLAAAQENWFLAQCATPDEKPWKAQAAWRVDVSTYPFRIGRLSSLHVCLPCPTISQIHAEIDRGESSLLLRDLASKNGTFLNGRRVRDVVPLEEGDVIQLASTAFRLGRDAVPATANATSNRANATLAFATAAASFDRLMSDRAIIPHFQPIVRTDDLVSVGFELLSRGTLNGLETPKAMFSAAERLNQARPLSMLLRSQGVQAGLRLTGHPNLFVNTHPEEIGTIELFESLREIRRLAPEQPITLEIHEAAVTSTVAMRALRVILNELDMRLAFDDFGAGQARLHDLADTPPDYVKFDIHLIRDIHLASNKRLTLLKSLVHMVQDLGIVTIAEGVEYEEELNTCRQLGFEMAQGFFFGRPAPVEDCADGLPE